MYPVFFLMLGALLSIFIFGFSELGFFTSLTLGCIVSSIGLQSIFGFIGHFFKSDDVARSIGWPAGNPFQKEIAFTNLSYGVLGILSIWFHGYFWLATILGKGVFTWGAAYIHYKDRQENNNTSIGNAGPVFYFDILLPLLLLVLFSMAQVTAPA